MPVRLPPLIGCLILLPFSGGCRIALEARSLVATDGSLTRTTRIIADDDRDKEEAEGRYDLPPGGIWTVRKVLQGARREREVGGTQHVYEMAMRYGAGESVASDYVRRSITPGRVSRNQPRLAVRGYVFVRVFDYEERFHDVATREGFAAASRVLYTAWIGTLAKGLSRELGPGAALPQVEGSLAATFDPLFGRFLDAVRGQSLAAFLRSQTYKEDFEPALRDDAMVARLAGAFPAPPTRAPKAWRHTLTRVLERSGESVERLFKKDKALGDELFGVYGFAIFHSYPFEVTLSLPGRVVRSNATNREGDLQTWKFNHEDFVMEDYVLRARSRIVYPARILLAAGLGLAGAWAIRARRRRPRPSVESPAAERRDPGDAS